MSAKQTNVTKRRQTIESEEEMKRDRGWSAGQILFRITESKQGKYIGKVPECQWSMVLRESTGAEGTN